MQRSDRDTVCCLQYQVSVCRCCSLQATSAESSQVAAEDRRDEAETRAHQLSERWQDAESAAAAARLETADYTVALQSLSDNHKQV